MKPGSGRILTLCFIILFSALSKNSMSLEHPSGWLAGSYLDLAREEVLVQDGSYGLLAELTTASTQSLKGQEIPVTAGETFNYSFYYNTSAHVRVKGVLEWTGATATYGPEYGGDGIDNTDYVLLEFSGTVPDGATGVRVRIDVNPQSGFNAAGEIQYFDDVRLESPVGSALDVYNNSFERWQNVGWTEIVRRSASDGAASNGYGTSVSIYGSYAAVGVPSKNKVYLLKKDQGGTENWGELKIITQNYGGSTDQFGACVSLSSQYLAVGAPQHRFDADSANILPAAGAVYIFRSSQGGTDNWGFYRKYVPGDRQEQDRFGESVSIWGQTFIVGCPDCDLDGDGLNFLSWAGAAYLFETPYTYVRKKFVAGDRYSQDHFGTSVSIIGNDVAIGAIQNDFDSEGQNQLTDAGAAYVFQKDQGGTNQWGQVKKVTAGDRRAGDLFGQSISTNGNTLLVGAYRNGYDENDENFLERSGACYLFGKDTGGDDNWGEIRKIVAPDRQAGDYFGYSVYMGYSDFIAGACYNSYDPLGENYLQSAGAAYQYSAKIPYTETWELVSKEVSGLRAEYSSFGKAVDMTTPGDYAIVGNPGNVDTRGGAASIFKPVIQASWLEFSDLTATSLTIFFASGEGESRVVFMKAGSTGVVPAQNNETYSANAEFGAGEQAASSGWYCVYNGTGHEPVVTGLDPDTEYRVMVCEYEGNPGEEKYYTCVSVNNPANIRTGMDLSGVGINIAVGLITGTSTDMQYSMNSTDGFDGDWHDCSADNTPAEFDEGPVYVRETGLVTNTSLVLTIAPAHEAPAFSINYPAEKTNEIVTSSFEYNFDNDFSTLNSSGPDNYLALTPGLDLYLRLKATLTALPGAVQHLEITERPAAPAYTIDFINESTAENSDVTHEYSTQPDMSGAVQATGTPIPINPGTDLYIRSKCTGSSFSGNIQHLVVPDRPPVNFNIDFKTETTSESVSPEVEYSAFPDMSQAADGTGMRISVTPGINIYFRKKATSSSFESEVQTLIVPERPEVPVVSLSDKNSAAAVFMKSADGSGEQVSIQDAIEYSENFGINWNPVTPAVSVNAAGMKHITARKMSTVISFASGSTGNLDYEIPVVTVVGEEACNGPDNSVTCRSNLDNGRIYLVAGNEPQNSVDDIKNVTAGFGTSAAVSTAGGDVLIPTLELLPGTYNAYAVNDWDSLSEAGAIPITIHDIPHPDLGPDIVKCEGTEVLLDAGAGYAAYSWAPGPATTQTLLTSDEGKFTATVTDDHGCVNSDSLTIRYNQPYGSAELCLVTIDEFTGNYLIVWERTPDAGIVDYNIYREGKLIGTVGYDELSVFEDSEVDPERRPYKYTMTTTDSCGNESEHSAYHIPIFLQYTGYIDGVNLSWAKYLIQGKEVQFNSYTVYKGSDSTSIVPFVENIPNEVTVYVDDDPLALEKKFYYRVAGILDNPCYPSGGDRKTQTGPYRHSLSNLDDNKLKEPGDSTGTDGLPCTDHKLSVYPNPFSLSATVMFPNPDNKPYTLVLSGLSGKIYRLVGEITTSEYILKRGDLKPGLYILELRGPKIYRGKLMIE